MDQSDVFHWAQAAVWRANWAKMLLAETPLLRCSSEIVPILYWVKSLTLTGAMQMPWTVAIDRPAARRCQALWNLYVANWAKQAEAGGKTVCLALLLIDKVLHGVHLKPAAHIWPWAIIIFSFSSLMNLLAGKELDRRLMGSFSRGLPGRSLLQTHLKTGPWISWLPGRARLLSIRWSPRLYSSVNGPQEHWMQHFFNPGDATVHCVLGRWLKGNASSRSFHRGTLTVCVAVRILSHRRGSWVSNLNTCTEKLTPK